MARNFTRIRAWLLADELAVAVYKITKNFPREEMYGLTSQLRRATCSVPANIAEGANRTSKREYLHFLSVASGSLGETRYFLHLSKRLGYIQDPQNSNIVALTEQTSKTLTGLISALQKEV